MSLTTDFPLTGNVLLLFKSRLQEQRSELARSIGRTHEEIRALADFGPGDIIDKSCDNSSKESTFSSYSRNRMHMRKIEAALERMATGDFGVCAACGRVIGLKRLEAMPWATNCIECQEQSEQHPVQ
jgi:DnaK suppressor protein